MCVDARGRYDGNSTWDSCGLCICFEGEDAGLRFALLILCHHMNLILCVPFQAVQEDIGTVTGKAELWFPVRYTLLRKGCRQEQINTLKGKDHFRSSTNVLISQSVLELT